MRGVNYVVETPPLCTQHMTWFAAVHRPASATLMFSIRPQDMTSTYRLVDQQLEARSVRRGSLQLLAKQGVPLETIMLFSGHARKETLLRYLDWGLMASDTRDQMFKSGMCLLPEDEAEEVDSLMGQTDDEDDLISDDEAPLN